jgi:hypothetical protein
LALGDEVHYLAVRDPKDIFFSVQYPGKPPIRLAGHFWYNAETVSAGKKCPAIVEFVPYRRRDGTMIADSKMYPWFAFNDYLCFRIDLQGSGDSEGVLTDEYTDEELTYCTQVIAEIAALPSCDGNVGMMGKSWSAINSLMVAARPDRPRALKAVLVCCGSDDRYNDDVHYMGGAMMFDNVSWPSSMFGWMSLPPDPAVVGDPWKEMWRERIRNADFWFKQWASNQPRDDYWAGQSEIQRQAAFAWVAWARGNRDEALRLASAAADAEDATEKSAATPGPLMPARELLGDMQFEAGRFGEAQRTYEAVLSKEPHRFHAEYGAGLAAERAGDPTRSSGGQVNYPRTAQRSGASAARSRVS